VLGFPFPVCAWLKYTFALVARGNFYALDCSIGKNADNAGLKKRLWDAADQLRANSELKSQEYSAPVLGLIFLRFAEVRFTIQRAALEKASTSSRRGSRVDEPAAYHAEGILYLPAEARFDYLLNRPEAESIGAKVNAAMRDIEKHNPQLAGVLPKTYNLFTSTLLKELLKKVSEIPASLDYDAFGRIYEYFLGEFPMSEGQGSGEFYTPSSIVRLLTEIIEPYHGRILETLRLAKSRCVNRAMNRVKLASTLDTTAKETISARKIKRGWTAFVQGNVI
jgi:type I restriction enzyme M protein